uniref:G-protein coupled receptors family 1 profile domain-containing protein n=1 Tax=Branchiostoma floridae TaxID=7739 RepID=C3YFL0_BRAFL|eukprot:XP_002604963.1 hypothetical protein BRAFLDRAFT_92603 [Branchiostoma floridae]
MVRIRLDKTTRTGTRTQIERAWAALAQPSAVDDIIFTGCLIPFRIYALFQQDVGGDHLWCSARMLVAPPCLTSMAGTYLMMGLDLYYFVCDPLHYHDKVTTKRVIVGIFATRTYSLLFGLGPLAFSGLPKKGLPCEIDPANSVSFILMFLTVSSMANPIVYSFRLREFRRACRELCGLPTNTPPAVPAQRHRDMEMAAIAGPEQGAPTTEPTQAQASADIPFDQAQKQTTQADMGPGLAPCTDHRGRKTTSERPYQLSVRAEVHAEPKPRSVEDMTETLPGQLHLYPESPDGPTSPMLDTKTDETTVGHTTDQFALKTPPSRPKIAWQIGSEVQASATMTGDDTTLQ